MTENGIAYSIDEAMTIANNVGYPVVVRPSFVLGGTSMDIVNNDTELNDILNSINQ